MIGAALNVEHGDVTKRAYWDFDMACKSVRRGENHEN